MLYSDLEVVSDSESDESSDNLYFGSEDEDHAAKSHIVEHSHEPDSPKHILLEQKIEFIGSHRIDELTEEDGEIVELERSIMSNPKTSLVLSNLEGRPAEENKENSGVEIGLPNPRQRAKIRRNRNVRVKKKRSAPLEFFFPPVKKIGKVKIEEDADAPASSIESKENEEFK